MSARKRVLIVSLSDIKRDPRVYRQTKHLSSKYEVATLGFGDSGLAGVTHIPIKEIGKGIVSKAKRAIMLKTHNFLGYYEATFDVKTVLESLKADSFDLVMANDSDSLPLVFSWAQGAPVLHDAHEYAPRQIEDRWTWRFFMREYMDWICKTYLKSCAAMTTVSQGIADEYSRNYHVQAKVITNAPDYREMRPTPVEEGRIRLVHHGNANPNRKIENYLNLVSLLDDRFSLDLYLMPRDPSYLEKMKRKATPLERVRIHDPIPMQELITTCNQYDIGIFFQEPLNFNLAHSLPNKLFEYVQARLAVAVTPLPDIKRLVDDYGLGVVCDEFNVDSMAKKLNRLSEQEVMDFKERSDAAAKPLSSESNMKELDAIVNEIMK